MNWRFFVASLPNKNIKNSKDKTISHQYQPKFHIIFFGATKIINQREGMSLLSFSQPSVH